MPRLRSVLSLAAFALLCGAVTRSASAQAQAGVPGTPGAASASRLYLGGSHGETKNATARTIVGNVKDEAGKPSPNAVVYLKNTRTSSIQVLITGPDGAYRFGPIPIAEDFTIWAQQGDVKTSIRAVSSFNPNPLMSLPLHFDPKPAPAARPENAAAPAAQAPPKH